MTFIVAFNTYAGATNCISHSILAVENSNLAIGCGQQTISCLLGIMGDRFEHGARKKHSALEQIL